MLATSSRLLLAARRNVPDHVTVRGRTGTHPVLKVMLPAQLPRMGLSLVPAGLTTRPIARHTDRPVASAAQTPNVEEPGATGVPLSAPLAFKVTPIGGNVPLCTEKRMAPTPPLAVNWKL